ncbi:MAG: redox-regulated ATPase YchF [Actinobacteria bacterium]|nr:redox-regulated ATPase YchF [Actinomycetota bacterium]
MVDPVELAERFTIALLGPPQESAVHATDVGEAGLALPIGDRGLYVRGVPPQAHASDLVGHDPLGIGPGAPQAEPPPRLGAVKDIGLVGVPFSGKSTLFTALTRAGSHGGQPNQAVVPVPDPRLGVLTEMERSRKTVAAQVRFVDVPGGVSSAQGIAKLREADALALVVRCFGSDALPAAELVTVRAELLLADLAVVESALHKAEKRAKGKPAVDVDALRKAKAALEAETPLRGAGLDADEIAELRGIAPLTLKPEIVVANLEEGTDVPPGLGADAVGVYASIEAETAEMDPGEARALLEEFGVKEPGLEKVIHAGYRALDLITFLTTGEDETRAWEVRRGATAPEAAGVIHTDLQRGFIRAETIGYEDLVAAGSMEKAKAAGKVRVEGKEYVVQEGDILHVRFAV